MTTVIKRDGLEENFDENKIIKILTVAGLNPQQASNIAQSISDWVNSLEKPAIKSTDISDKVVEQLKASNPDIADLFAWYEQTKLKT